MKRFLLLSIAALATLLPAAAGPLSLTLDPVNGQVSGPAGTNVGWGFTLNGDTTDWLVVTAVHLGGDPFPVGSFANFTDLLSTWVGSNVPLAPGGTLTQSWAGGLGLAQFAIPGVSSTNDVGAFNILVDYDLYDSNPFTDPNANYIDPGLLGPRQFSNTAQITVTAPDAGSGAPEPGTWVLFLTAAPLIVLGRRRTRRA